MDLWTNSKSGRTGSNHKIEYKDAARDGDSEIYTANNLNQYTQRTVPGVAQVAGTAAEDATVTINRPSISGITVEPVTRQGAYFHKKLALDNSAGADVEEIAVVGVKAGAGTNGTDIVSTYSGVVWAAQSPERFTYDDDGNMLADALRKYEWDAENRLISVTVSNVVDGSLTRVEFSYDYQSRRISKKIYSWNSESWLLTSGSFFTYDGWNMIKEICSATGKGTITDYYIWGLDLSGSLQGAGGIGGLLARYRSEQRYYDEQGMLLICHRPPGNPENEQTLRINESAWPAHASHGDSLGACAGGSVSNSAFLYTFDGNGNVSELLLSSVVGPLSSVAHYEYSPFGETIVATGPEAQDNPFRFSTKYFVDELGIGDWGRRWYLPPLGRWLSRDPIGEAGGLNLYLFIENAGINLVDHRGLLLTEYAQDVTAISITPAELPEDTGGKTKATWPFTIAFKTGGIFGLYNIEIKGALTITINYNSSLSDPYTDKGADGLTIAAHEQHHAQLAKDWWKALKSEADPLERKWCPRKCADLGVILGNAASKYWYAQMRVAEAQYDVDQYGGQKAEAKLRQRKQGAENTKIIYDKAKDDWDASGCAK